MANMGYCRFRNTHDDLVDCCDHQFDDLDEEEQEAYERMLEIMIRMLENHGYSVRSINDD